MKVYSEGSTASQMPESLVRLWGEQACQAFATWLGEVVTARRRRLLPEAVQRAWGKEVTAAIIPWLEDYLIADGILSLVEDANDGEKVNPWQSYQAAPQEYDR